MDALSRFECFVIPEPNSGCHLWLGAYSRGGHGWFRVGSLPYGVRRKAYPHQKYSAEIKIKGQNIYLGGFATIEAAHAAAVAAKEAHYGHR